MASIRFTCEDCGTAMTARPEYAGSPVACHCCGALLKVPKPVVGRKPLTEVEEDDGSQKVEYKVLAVADAGARIPRQQVEDVLNHLARKGWALRGIISSPISSTALGVIGDAVGTSVGFARDEVLIIMERGM